MVEPAALPTAFKESEWNKNIETMERRICAAWPKYVIKRVKLSAAL